MNLTPVLRQRFFDANGNPLAGGKLYSYQAGTSTPQATYTDSTGATPNANPVVLDANGEASLWLEPTYSYKFVLTDANDVNQWTVDNVVGLLSSGSVVTESLADLSVTQPKVALGAIGSGQLKSSASVDADRAVTTNHLRDGVLSANTAGLAKMADGYLSVGAAGLAKMADGYLSADAAGRAKMADGFLSQAKLAARAVKTDGTDPGAGGVSISGPSGDWNLGSNGGVFGQVTNHSVTLTTTGRPVKLLLIEDGSTNLSYVGVWGTANTICSAQFQFKRGGTVISAPILFAGYDRNLVAPSALSKVDTPPAGVHTYTLEGRGGSSNATDGTARCVYTKLVAFEE